MGNGLVLQVALAERQGKKPGDISYWAVHPGGWRILSATRRCRPEPIGSGRRL
ncbi:MAG: Chalcone and stilbene synthase, C-terminal domain [Pseudomonadota bacterium]